MQTPDIEFLKQFREEAIALPGKRRRFATAENYLFTRLLEERIALTTQIRQLINKIEDEDQAISCRIAAYIKRLLPAFASFVRMDLGSTQYFMRLSKEIRQLLDWISVYQVETETPLLKSLRGMTAKKNRRRENKFFCCKNIDNAETAIQIFLDGLCRYYEILCHYFELESESSGKTLVVSETGRRLYGLLILIGKQINFIESTIVALHDWKEHSRNIEMQEIYN